ncbi:reticulocyte-binding protein homolog 2a-like [Impatiens glandulifera]|uniref:reticulocyte-binding protein homolog 2a-like n=1 Tax=Impatiens glandulifera TaxID=253017 RepID=UPI001FB0E06F|nr:reticulocyte-binding protein homolog 2a-like [Impatiens glandulifera]
MDSNSKIQDPSKNPLLRQSSISQNSNPNILKNPELKSPISPTPKSAGSKNPNQITSPSSQIKTKERKFVLVKRKSNKDIANHSTVACQCKDKVRDKSNRCVCIAYESLRISHEEFFKNQTDRDENTLKEDDGLSEMGIKRSREKVLKDDSKEEKLISDSGSGRVKLLVKAFEMLNTKSNNIDHKQSDEDEKEMNWASPEVTTSSFSRSDFLMTSECLGLDSSSSIDRSQGSFRVSRSQRRKSLESSGSSKWKRNQQQKLKPTCQKPFNLRTEERGRNKEEELMKKVKQVKEEEEKLRIPIAQGLPWTTEQPELLVKPPSKEITIPVDLKLHSDIRAVERAEFNQYVVEKISFIEQCKMEIEREQKLAEEEEIRRLRKELVPKAQPMPYFDRPFVPKRLIYCTFVEIINKSCSFKESYSSKSYTDNPCRSEKQLTMPHP